jgi:hypothetical protein
MIIDCPARSPSCAILSGTLTYSPALLGSMEGPALGAEAFTQSRIVARAAVVMIARILRDERAKKETRRLWSAASRTSDPMSLRRNIWIIAPVTISLITDKKNSVEDH